MKVGLFFGSFNPIHTGHLIIAQHFVSWCDVDQVWLIVSPQNPFKEKASLLDEKHRLYMANLAVEDNYRLRASTIEFHLPRPSYTIDTLTYMEEQYPDTSFTLLMGSDTLSGIHKWKNSETLLQRYPIYVYERPGSSPGDIKVTGNIQYTKAPLLQISATFIRDAIAAGKDIRYLVPEKVYNYIDEMHFYKG
jgi:nicotinate-nucleotide adenylyltransferase